MRGACDILDLIGNTPLLSLERLTGPQPVRIFAKAELANPSGSVKDRAARALILDGIARGELTPERTLIDATSGNTGIAYSMIGAALGLKVTLFLPANASRERKSLIRAYGAEIVETDPLESSDGAFLAARAEYESAPSRYFYPDQYNNPVNPRAHYEGTAPEILAQTGGAVTHFICGMGTSGTFVGTSRRLKEADARVKCVAVQPDSPLHGIEGTKHMASTIRPGIYDRSLADAEILVSTEEAYATARRIARTCGILCGISSGANAAAAIKLSRALPRGSVIVTVLGDTGSRYLTDGLFP
ncbi:MAG: cysteine synthase family protein [Deltaproteobacteria bacterium]|jgi:cysteine synthase B|nr:cysteine synthase family protein [Deltaproteobacteria bacterium]